MTTPTSPAERMREEAARWHEHEAHLRIDSLCVADDPSTIAKARSMAALHRECAAAIRTLPLPAEAESKLEAALTTAERAMMELPIEPLKVDGPAVRELASRKEDGARVEPTIAAPAKTSTVSENLEAAHQTIFKYVHTALDKAGFDTLSLPLANKALYRGSLDAARALADAPCGQSAPRPLPTAWMRGVSSPSTPHGPAEYDVEFVYGDDPPGDGWIALYRAPRPLPTEEQIAVALCCGECIAPSRCLAMDWYAIERAVIMKLIHGDKA